MAEMVVLELGGRWAKWRDLAGVLAGLRGLDGNWSDPATLRKGIELAIELGELLGAESAWTARLKSVLEDERLWEVVKALVGYVSHWMGEADKAGERGGPEPVRVSGAGGVTVEAEALVAWLPVVLELISLWRSVRRGGGR